MTGALKGAARTCVQQYNRCVDRLEELDVLQRGPFDALPQDAGMDEVGVSATLLADYIAEDGDEADPGGPKWKFRFKQDLGEMVRSRIDQAFRDENVHFGGPMGHRRGEEVGQRTQEMEHEMQELTARMQELAARMASGETDMHARADLGREMGDLGRQQARIAREIARRLERARER